MTVDEAIAAAEQEWRRLGVTRRDRAALAADLRLDLQAAAADGVSAEQLLDDDVRGFARRLADEAGMRPAPGRYEFVLVTAATGAAAGALLGVLTVYLVHTVLVGWFDLPRSLRVPVALAVSLHFGAAAAIAIGGAVAAVRVLLRQLPAIRATANTMAVLLPVGVAVVTPLILALADWTNYSMSPPILITEIALSIAAFLAVTALARYGALRRHRQATADGNEAVPFELPHGPAHGSI